MADEIRQKMVFEVIDAVNNLKRFKTEVLGVNTTLEQLARTAGNSGGVKKLSVDIDDLGESTKRASQKIKAGASSSVKSVDKLTTSLKLLSRVVFTQAIVRGLTTIRLQLEQSIGKFIEFERAVAEVETISSSFASFGELEEVTKNLSNNFNIDLIDATRGAYQAVSNQIIKSVDDFEKLNEIALFAKATNTSFNDSVNLVSGTLNAYGLDISQANELTSQFFKTIELGKTRANELTTGFARLAPLAAQLGIKTEEVNGAIATLTIGGLNTSQAVTQLLGTFNALVKTTPEARKVLKDLGVTTSKELITTLGYQGALDALANSTNGSAEEVAKLIPRIRGLSGALTLTGKLSDVLASNIEKIGSVAAETASEKGLGVLEKRGQTVDKFFNQLSNTLTTEFGQKLTGILENTISLFNDIETPVAIASDGIKGLGLVLGSGVVAFTTYKAALGLVRLELIKTGDAALFAGKAARTAAGGLAAIFAAIELGNQIGDTISAFQLGEVAQLGKAYQAVSKQIEQATDDNVKVIQKQRDETKKAAGALIIELRKLYIKDTENLRFEAENKALVFKEALDGVIDSQKARVKELERVAQDSTNELKRSIDRSKELGETISDIKFSEKIRELSEADQFSEQLKRSTEIANAASRALRGARTPDEITSGLSSLDRAEAAAREAKSIAEALGDRRAEKAAIEQIVRIKQNQLGIERKIQDQQRRQRKEALEAAAVEKSRLSRLKDSVSRISKLTSPFDKDGNVLSAEDRAKRKKDISLQLDLINKEIRNSDKAGIDDILGVANLSQRINENLTNNEIKTLKFADSIFDEFAKQLAEKQIELNLAIADQENRDRGLANAEDRARLDGARNQTQLSIDAQKLLIREAAQLAFSNLGERIDQTVNDVLTLGQFNDTRTDKIAEARAIVNAVASAGLNGTATQQFLAEQSVLLKQILATNDIGNGEAGVALNSLFDSVAKNITNQNTLAEQTRQLGEASSLNLQEARKQTQQLEIQTQILRNGGFPTTNGALNRAQGGGVRGTDSIPAMLSPGEFVVNARSSRRFFSQLQTINSGASPVNRQQGGSVTNVTIGDVNVTGGNTSRQTGRAIAGELHREIRRGTSRRL